MDESIKVSLTRIGEIVDSFGGREFTTADVLRVYSGGFYSNNSTPPHYSFNAQFGKLLKRNAEYLGITEIRSNERIKDDNGHQTSASVWQRKT